MSKIYFKKIKIDIKKTMLFIFAGSMGAITSLLIYAILLKVLGVWYLYASIIAFILASFAGFCFQKYITFKDVSKGNIKKQIFYYFIFAGFNLILNIIILSFFVEFLKIDSLIAKILTLGIIAVWSYFIYQKYIYK